MSIGRLIYALCLIAPCTIGNTVAAQEVTLQHQGLTLNAELTLASGKKLGDGVILITHGALAHRDMDSLLYLRKLLQERGYNTLAINLSLGINNRHGMYDCQQTQRHHNDDAVTEIGVWLNWLGKHGARHVILLGHSRGGAQTALYAAEHHNSLVRAVVLLAPAIKENTDSHAYQQRYQQALAPLLKKARQLVHTGKGATLLTHVGFLTCADTAATAETFVSYYGQSQRLDTPSLLPKIQVPTLIVVAGDDQIVVGLDKKVASLIDGKRRQMRIVAGADHLFRDLYADDAVEAIDAFLRNIPATTRKTDGPASISFVSPITVPSARLPVRSKPHLQR